MRPGVHDRDAVGDRERLLLVVRDVDGGRAVGALQLADLDAHVDAQLGVEVGQRLVEHQQRRFDHERAGQRHALLLAARERRGIAVGERAEADALQHRRDAPGALGPAATPRCFRPKATLSATLRCGKQRVVLEDEADVALVRRAAREVAVAEPDGARVGRQEAGDEAQASSSCRSRWRRAARRVRPRRSEGTGPSAPAWSRNARRHGRAPARARGLKRRGGWVGECVCHGPTS